MKAKNFEWILTVIAISAAGCGKIPKAYRGTFVDSATGARIELASSKGSIQISDGRIVEAEANDLDFEKLSKGDAGIYVSIDPAADKLVEVYWVDPRVSTRHEAGGLVWFESEVLFTRMDTQRSEDVDGFKIFHCHEGTVMVDSVTHLWEIGCPSGTATTTYDMKRINP